MALTLLVLKLIGMFGIPLSLEPIFWHYTVAVKAVATRWSKVFYYTLPL